MPAPETREAEHSVDVAAAAETVYRQLADVATWPTVFPPTLHVEHLEGDGDTERIRIWATANGRAKQWTSRRRLDPSRKRIEFRQEVSAAPVASMEGAWTVEPLDPHRSRVRLHHRFRAVGDDPHGLDWIDRAVDRNSNAELAALKSHLERRDPEVLVFEDTVRIRGPLEEVYAFVDRADQWPVRLPHVAAVRLDEEEPGVQRLEMETRAPDGSTHTTVSYRVGFAPGRIVYKQTMLPALMTLHTGQWTFVQDGDDVAATSRHAVVVNEHAIPRVLGAAATPDQAKEYVRSALGANSRATLQLAKTSVERLR
ncbi:aromatase/cyclase [Streptomyces sp. NPDC035033]|uniref:aromatase/cyclase n=1 Tax=Streptomyces sp. NPDC035033 TaxID=3155368 RepID=UPI0033D7B04B